MFAGHALEARWVCAQYFPEHSLGCFQTRLDNCLEMITRLRWPVRAEVGVVTGGGGGGGGVIESMSCVVAVHSPVVVHRCCIRRLVLEVYTTL